MNEHHPSKEDKNIMAKLIASYFGFFETVLTSIISIFSKPDKPSHSQPGTHYAIHQHQNTKPLSLAEQLERQKTERHKSKDPADKLIIHPLSVFKFIFNGLARRKILVISTFVILFFLPIAYLTTRYQSKTEAAWMNDQWGYRQTVAITNAGAAQTDFQVAITLNTSALVTAGKMQSDCDDIRVTDVNGKILAHWIETGTNACNTATTAIWTKVPSISTTGTTVYLYYGNPSAASAQNGGNVFLFFDDFSGPSIDSAKWTSTTGSPSISSGKLVLDAAEGLFAGSYAIPANTIWVSLADPQATTRTGGAIRASTTTSTGWVNDGASNIVDILWWSNDQLYSETNSGESGFGAYAIGFKKYKITYRVSDADSVSYDYNDGALTSTRTGSNAAGTLYPVMYSSNGQSQYDWFFIRKTAATEPAIAAPANEQKSLGPVAYWKFDEGYGANTYDSTPNSNTGTITAATWQSEDQCISGKCLYFDETGDNVNLGGNDSLTNNISDITIGAWVRLNAKLGTASDNYEIISNESYQNYGYLFRVENTTSTSTSGKIHLRFSQASAATAITAPSNTYPDDHQWHYLVGVKEGSAGRIYLDGKLVYNSTGLSNPVNSGASTYIGGSGQLWNGFLDEVKVYNYARTAAQIKSDFASKGSGSVKGTSAALGVSSKNSDALSNGLVGYWKMDEASWTNDCTATSVTDSSGNGNNGKACPATTGPTGGASGKFGNNGNFDGTDDNTSVTSSSSLSPTSAISMSAWVNLTALDVGGNNEIVQKSGSFGMKLTSGGKFIGYRWSGSEAHPSTTTITAGTWYFVTMTFDGSTHKTYVNGSLEASENDSSSIPNTSNAITIGGPGVYFNGKIDETRIYNRALSPREVRDLYNWAPGPKLYYNLEEGSGSTVNDISGSGYTGTVLNGTNTIVGKFGKGRETADASTGITFSGFTSGSEWSMMAWSNFPLDSNGGSWRTLFANNGGGYHHIIVSGTSGAGEIGSYNGGWYSSGYNIGSLTGWHHVAAIASGSTTKFYIDGVLVGTANTIVNYNVSIVGNYWTSGDQTWGKFDDVKIYNYARTNKQIVEDMNAGHPVGGSPVGSQVGYWKFDEGYGVTVNNSGNAGSAVNGTWNGSNSHWSNSGKFGKAGIFNGNADYVEAGNGAAVKITGPFTLSAWVSPNNSGNDIQGLITKDTAYNLWYHNGFSSLQGFSASINGTSSTKTVSFVDDTTGWKYITASFDGSTLKLYKDGILQSSASASNPSDNNYSLRIGMEDYNGGNNPADYRGFNGLIDEVKIYNAALTEDEIKLDYNHGSAMVLGKISTDSDGTTPSDADSRGYCIPGDTTSCSAPVGEWKFEEKTGANAYDTSGNGYTGTLTGSGATWTTGKTGSAVSLATANSDYVRTSQTGITGNNQELTVEAWVYSTNYTGLSHPMIVAKGVNQEWILWQEDDTANNSFAIRLSGTGCTTSYGTTTAQNSTWYHVAGTFSKSTGIQSLYINGKLEDQDTGLTGCTPNSGTREVTMGVGNTGTVGSSTWANGFSGKIDRVKIYNYARTPAQIAYDYNRGAPVGHWKMDECQGITANDSSGNGNTGTITIGATGTQTAVGTCTTSGTAWYNGVTGKYNSSLNFDGTDDYVNVGDPSSGILDVTGTFTISAWIKFPDSANNQTIYSKTEGSTSGSYWFVKRRSGLDNKLTFQSFPSSSNVMGNVVPANIWQHVAVTYNSAGNVVIYQDGVQTNSAAAPDTVTANSINVNIGQRASNDQRAAGQIDDVKIFNYAVTANQVKTLYNKSAINFAPVTGSP